MLIGQLSDLHVSPPGSVMTSFVDSSALLAAAIGHLNGLDRVPDVVLATGDLVNDGTVEEYQQLRDLLAPLEAPVLLLPGNHDVAAGLREVFSDHPELGTDGPIQWCVDDHALRLVGLDTTLPNQHDGLISPDALEWLEGTLKDGPDRPTVVALHHPPFATGMWWMDYGGTPGSEELRALIGRHPQVRRVVCGHVHRAFQTNWGSTVVSSAPSLSYQSALALHDRSEAAVTNHPMPIPLLQWDGRDLLSFHTDFNVDADRIALADVIGDWPAYQAACRAGSLPKSIH